MSERPLVIYHDGCWDGFCAAWLFHRAMPDAEFFPAKYGQPAPDCTGREVYIVDFSYKQPVMIEISQRAKKLVVLDHHESAAAELAGLSAGSDEGLIRFDMAKSGGRLAWEYLWRLHFGYRPWREGSEGRFVDEFRPPWLVCYTEDRDMWKWELEKSREINAALRSYPLDFELWDRLSTESYVLSRLMNEGCGILRREAQLIDAAVGHAREIEFADKRICENCGGRGHYDDESQDECGACNGSGELETVYKVLCVNATCLVSDTAGKLAEGRPFGVVYFDLANGKRIYSLRSKPDGLNVAEIAARRGGGGHRHAAGFETAIPT